MRYEKVEKNGRCGYIDKTGKEVINSKYRFADAFSEGVARVLKDGKWLEIDKYGKELK
jgi:hypothetical protein